MRGGGIVTPLAALSGAVGVAAGAFAAHGASAHAAGLIRTGAEYQMIHAAAALFATGVKRGGAAGWALLGGSALFAGSLYGLAFGGPRWLGPVTPVGGAGMIVGWLLLAFRR